MSTHAFNLPFPQTNSLPHALVFTILIKPLDPCPLMHLIYPFPKQTLFYFFPSHASCFLSLSPLSLPKQIQAKSPPKHQFSEQDLLLTASKVFNAYFQTKSPGLIEKPVHGLSNSTV